MSVHLKRKRICFEDELTETSVKKGSLVKEVLCSRRERKRHSEKKSSKHSHKKKKKTKCKEPGSDVKGHFSRSIRRRSSDSDYSTVTCDSSLSETTRRRKKRRRSSNHGSDLWHGTMQEDRITELTGLAKLSHEEKKLAALRVSSVNSLYFFS